MHVIGCSPSGSLTFQGLQNLHFLERVWKAYSYMGVRHRPRRRPCRTGLMAHIPGFLKVLMRVQNISWREHKTKAEIYGDIHPISSIVDGRRTRFAGHCSRAKDQIISDVISLRLPCPTRGRRPLNYIDCIASDIGHEIADMQTLMSDRDTWRGIVYSISDASAK